MSGRVSANIFAVEVTPTIDTSAYAAGDQLGSLMTLSTGIADDAKNMTLLSVAIVDKAKQDAAIDILLFDESPTVSSSDNAALDISDAEMVDKCCGFVEVADSKYSDLNANSVAFVGNIGLNCKYVTDGTLYAIMNCQGTPTYTSTSDLVLRFTFLADL